MITSSENFVIQDELGVLTVTITTKKRWGWFVATMLEWLVMSLFIVPLSILAIGSLLQRSLPKSLSIFVWVILIGLFLYIIYKKLLESIEYLFDKATIIIDNQAIKLEKSGLGLRIKKQYPAENIKGLSFLIPSNAPFTWFTRLPLVSTNVDAFALWHQRGLKKWHSFGRGLPYSDAQIVLNKVFTKFPQYRYSDNP